MSDKPSPKYNKPRPVRWAVAPAARTEDIDLPDNLAKIRREAEKYRALRDRVFEKVTDPSARAQLVTGGH